MNLWTRRLQVIKPVRYPLLPSLLLLMCNQAMESQKRQMIKEGYRTIKSIYGRVLKLWWKKVTKVFFYIYEWTSKHLLTVEMTSIDHYILYKQRPRRMQLIFFFSNGLLLIWIRKFSYKRCASWLYLVYQIIITWNLRSVFFFHFLSRVSYLS